MLIVRFAPLPPREMFSFGTRVGIRRAGRDGQVSRIELRITHREGDIAGGGILIGGFVRNVADGRGCIYFRKGMAPDGVGYASFVKVDREREAIDADGRKGLVIRRHIRIYIIHSIRIDFIRYTTRPRLGR